MLIFRMLLECATPLHCGGGNDDVQDQPVIRDAFGNWIIPGSSLAGSLRSIARNLDRNLADRLFGFQQDDTPHASLVWCEDALFMDFDGKPCLAKILAGKTPMFRQEGPFIRDHVALGLETGAAEKGAKFDAEFVPAGSRFLLETRCDGWDRRLSDEEKEFFTALCGEILTGNLSLGGKAGLGYGHYRALEHSFTEIDLFEPEGMNAWLGLEPYSLQLPGKPLQAAAVTQARVKTGLDGWLEVPLECVGPILIGGGASRGQDGADEADILFALTPRLEYDKTGGVIWTPTLPASSLRGVLRHGIHDILTALACPKEKSAAILNKIFGHVDGENAAQGKLEIEDSVLACPENPWQFVQHVAIDRFTCAALDGALFSEEPCWRKGVKTVLRLRARELAAHEAALLFHALFDLFDGVLTVGSGANRGNGRLALHGWAENPAASLNLASGSISWNGKAIFGNGNAAKTLTALSGEWDQALKEKAANV